MKNVRSPQKIDTYVGHKLRQIRLTVGISQTELAARDKCINHYGVTCSVCDFNFEKKYGDIGEGFIHVHHLTELSSIRSEYQIDPIEDLRPVCPNCHAMLHKRNPAYTIEELREKILY